MRVALGVCPADLDAARDLLRWHAELDPGPAAHKLLLIGGALLTETDLADLAQLAKTSFAKVDAIKLRTEPDKKWPNACNVMFQNAVAWIKQNDPSPFLWLEPDAIPLAPHWLDQLEAEYLKIGKPFMGAIHDQPWKHLNGVAIYPQHIAKFNLAMLGATDRPWDLTNHGATLKHAHNSPLMQRSIADPVKNLAHTFPDAAAVEKIIRPGVILFHGCRDGSLIDVLRQQHVGDDVRRLKNSSSAIAQHASRFTLHASRSIAAAVRKVKDAVRGTPAFYHSGNLGDLIYSLYAIQLHLSSASASSRTLDVGPWTLDSLADLIVGPEQRATVPCSNPISESQFHLLLPLLKTQSYLRRITWQPHHPGTSVTKDLNEFRNLWRDPGLRARTNIQTLCQMHCHLLGVAHRFDPAYPWLAAGLAGQAIYTGKIIVARSPRYQNPAFPWRTLLDQYADRMLFVGLPEEHRAFQNLSSGPRHSDTPTLRHISFYHVRDFLELARLIAGGCAFLGNQSFPMAIAMGLGQRTFQETDPKTPDCLFNRETLIHA